MTSNNAHERARRRFLQPPCSVTASRWPRTITLLILIALVLTGCKVQSTSSSFRKWNVNGRLTITKKQNELSRRLETTGDVKLQDGRIVSFPKDASVKIVETGGSGSRQAELRENAGTTELWMADNGAFRKGSPEDEKWLEGFLRDITAN